MASHDHGSLIGVEEKVLVVCAGDRAGADAVAAMVQEVLGSQGADVTVQSAADCEGLHGYDMVVIGTELWKDRIEPDALGFARAHGDLLTSTPTACFAVRLGPKDNGEENRRLTAERLKPLTDLLKPVDVAVFGGAVNPARLPALSRLVHQRFRRDARDHRDWDAIRFWAGGLLAKARGEPDDL